MERPELLESPSVPQAVQRVVDAAERLLREEIRLTGVAMRETATQGIQTLAFLFASAILLTGGWLIFTFAVADIVLEEQAWGWKLCLAAGLNVVAGAVLLAIGINKAKHRVGSSDGANGTGLEATRRG